ncbi:MAG: hypothetical protein JNK21_01015 [Rhodospirillaceae bacterium]|nr:hypothetical protein [Rhodospirillaceae bacterium]
MPAEKPLKVAAACCLAILAHLSAGSATGRDAKPSTQPQMLAFPGAQGWAATTPGGRGGKIIKVTTLASAGPGSLREAIETKGPRIVVFEVGGVVDLERKSLKIAEPFLTIAGQTAPSPGITLIRGGIDITGHDIVMQHIRVRTGEAEHAKYSGWDEDSISTIGAYNVIVDHVSATWGTDENLSASGPRFTGNTPEEWRKGTSHRITFSNNIIAEGLSHSTHSKLEHSKGSLIHDNVTDILIVGNLYAHNEERNPLFKGGVRGVIVNNLIYNPGARALHYNLMANEWGDKPYQTGQMVAVGNVLRAGHSTPANVAFLTIGGYGDLEFYGADNIALDQIGRPMPMLGRYTTSPAKIVEVTSPPLWPTDLKPMPAAEVQKHVLAQAGARPWDRDYNDIRVTADVGEARGKIIDGENEVHGYPKQAESRRAFDPRLWDLNTMTPLKPEALDKGAGAKGT